MRRDIIALVLAIGLAVAGGAAATSPDQHLKGLAIHKETGRNIYLGALYADDPATDAQDFLSGQGASLLEHRVVARRTSVRSLLGKLLLQGELASGNPPGAEVEAFADAVMSAVQGSLYAGDSLTISAGSGNTLASLNGFELARSDDPAVFNYFLLAWVGEKGPSTAFRTAILSPRIDAALLDTYRANGASEDRLAVVAGWFEPAPEEAPPAPPPPAAPQSSPQVATAGQEAEALTATGTAADTPAADDTAGETSAAESTGAESTAAKSTAAVSTGAVSTGAVSTGANDTPEPAAMTAASAAAIAAAAAVATDMAPGLAKANAPGPTLATATQVQIGGEAEPAAVEPAAVEPAAVEPAAVEPADQSAPEAPVLVAMATPAAAVVDGQAASDIAAIDAVDYSQRLGLFNTALIKRVYSEIRYPRAAVRRNIQGSLELDVTLRRDGSLVEVAIGQSSGYSMLDKSAVAAANKALKRNGDPVDPVAIAEYGDDRDQVIVPVPVSFILTE